jgi:hypothetical protein
MYEALCTYELLRPYRSAIISLVKEQPNARPLLSQITRELPAFKLTMKTS